MSGRFRRIGERAVPWAIDSIVLAGLFWGALGPSPPPAGAEARPVANSPPIEVASSSNWLQVNPSNFTLHRGSNVSLDANWGSTDPDCRVQPIWYRWSVESENATGFLDPTSGRSSTFFGDSFVTGRTTILVRSSAVEQCRANQTVVNGSATASVFVVVPLVTSLPVFNSSLLLPGQPARLNGSVEDGEPPYAIEVRWGDGTNSSFTETAPGNFSIVHRYPAGSFAPEVSVWDSAGDWASSEVDANLSVSSGLAVGLVSSAPSADVGTVVRFEGLVRGSVTSDVPLFDCSNGTVGGAVNVSDSGQEVLFSCTFTSTGTADVLFGEYPTQSGPSASVVLHEQVVSVLRVSAVPSTTAATVGSNVAIVVNVQGGSPPFDLQWNASGTPGEGTEAVSQPGPGVVSLSAGGPGDYRVWMQTSDASGAVTVSELPRILFEPPANATAEGASSVRANASLVSVAGTILSGCPPFQWWSLPAVLPSNETGWNGTIPELGTFAWNGSFVREGNLTVVVGVADSCGTTWERTLLVPLVPLLSVTVSVIAAPVRGTASHLEVNVTVGGGAAPFRLYVDSSVHQNWNRSMASDGNYQWILATNQSGLLRLIATVTDSFGVSVLSNLTCELNGTGDGVVLPAPTPKTSVPLTGPPSNDSGPASATSPDPTGYILGGLLALGGAGVGLFLRARQRRAGQVQEPPPDAESTLRGIIEPADGAERFTVELLAEEAGVPLSTVRSTIDRLVQEKKILAEKGADDEEVLSWTGE